MNDVCSVSTNKRSERGEADSSLPRTSWGLVPNK